MTAAAFADWLRGWVRILRFSGYALAAALSKSSYSALTRSVALKQIYFTAWQILLPFTLFTAALALLVTRITVETARDFGLSQYALELILRGLVLELVPLLTALLVALRSGAAIATEIALMQVAGEFDAMERAGEDPMRGEFVPRVASVALSIIVLTVLACALSIVIAYLEMYGTSPWGFAEFTRIVGKLFGPATLAGFALKCALFGAAVAIIPIRAGLDATDKIKSAPVAVMGGMVRVFFAIGVIEVVSLAARYV